MSTMVVHFSNEVKYLDVDILVRVVKKESLDELDIHRHREMCEFRQCPTCPTEVFLKLAKSS